MNNRQKHTDIHKMSAKSQGHSLVRADSSVALVFIGFIFVDERQSGALKTICGKQNRASDHSKQARA